MKILAGRAQLFLALAALLPLAAASLAHAAKENGASRGGGNGVVCFRDAAIAAGLTVRDPQSNLVTRYLPIPDSAISGIRSVTSFDLYLASLRRGEEGTRRVIGLSDGLASKPGMTLEQEFLRYAYRFEGIYSGVRMELERYAQMLPFSQAAAYDFGLQPVHDIPRVGLLPPSCVLATVFVQTGTDDSAAWGFDARLFYHPAHTRLSQVVFLLHERFYLKARTEKEAVDSFFVTQLTARALDPETTFGQLLSDFLKVDAHNKLGADAYMDIDWEPMHFLTILYNYLGNRESSEGKPAALALYYREYREKLLAMNELPPAFRKSVDENVIAWYSGQGYRLVYSQFDILGWKVPLPAGYRAVEVLPN